MHFIFCKLAKAQKTCILFFASLRNLISVRKIILMLLGFTKQQTQQLKEQRRNAKTHTVIEIGVIMRRYRIDREAWRRQYPQDWFTVEMSSNSSCETSANEIRFSIISVCGALLSIFHNLKMQIVSCRDVYDVKIMKIYNQLL